MTISCIAMRSDRPGVMLVPLENPRQTSAFDYAHQYGSESPKFCRAMAVAVGDYATTFVSGTASITASETRHLDDVRRQTVETLDNIEALIAADNFRGHGLAGFGANIGRSGLGPGVPQAARRLRPSAGDLRVALGRIAHDLRGGRYLPE